jgi:hypothetical protein
METRMPLRVTNPYKKKISAPMNIQKPLKYDKLPHYLKFNFLSPAYLK